MASETKDFDEFDAQKVPLEGPPPYISENLKEPGPSSLSSDSATPLIDLGSTSSQDEPSTSTIPQRPSTPPPPPPDDPSFRRQPANYISIIQRNARISDVWSIDTSLVPPDWFLGPLLSPSLSYEERESQLKEIEKEGTGMINANGRLLRPNLRLKSRYNSIEAKVRFVNGAKDALPAVVTCETGSNRIELEVTWRGVQKLFIKALSSSGSIDITVPHDFEGLIDHRTHDGSFTLSEDLSAKSTTFSVHQGVGRTFIGDWKKYNYGPVDSTSRPSTSATGFKTLAGLDTLVVESRNGNIKVAFGEPRS